MSSAPMYLSGTISLRRPGADFEAPAWSRAGAGSAVASGTRTSPRARKRPAGAGSFSESLPLELLVVEPVDLRTAVGGDDRDRLHVGVLGRGRLGEDGLGIGIDHGERSRLGSGRAVQLFLNEEHAGGEKNAQRPGEGGPEPDEGRGPGFRRASP